MSIDGNAIFAFTIAEEHVGKSWVKVRGRTYSVTGWIGRILPGDVGKRVFEFDNSMLQVENNEQRDARLARDAAMLHPSFDESEHEHVWGPVQHARFTGNPHRKCTVDGCQHITLDLRDDDDPSEPACEMHKERLDALLEEFAKDTDVYDGDYFLTLDDMAFAIKQAQTNERDNWRGLNRG